MSKCGGKIRYRSRLDALIVLARAQLRSRKSQKRRECRVYECPRCHGWHLTSQQRRTAPKGAS